MYEKRRSLAISNFCKGWLYVNGFLTEKEYLNVHKKLLKYKNKHRIEISEAQLDSVSFTYDDNAKDE